MGFTIIPICKKCGYKTESIAVGGGRRSRLTQCSAPAWNTETDEIEEINLYGDINKAKVKQRFLYFFHRYIIIEKMNEKYIPYYDSKMFIDDIKIKNHNWGNKYYKKSKNFCPKCKSFNLDFLQGGIYFD